jgi:hypothetical protein
MANHRIQSPLLTSVDSSEKTACRKQCPQTAFRKVQGQSFPKS